MKIKTNTRVEIGRLFACLQYGEMIAHDCAAQQAGMSPGRYCGFFTRQARQELHHARVFSRIVLCVTPRGARPVPDGLQQFRTRLGCACRRRDALHF